MRLLTDLRYFLVPHTTNNHRPKLLSGGSLSFLVVLFLIAQVGLNFFSLVLPSVLGFASSISPTEIVNLTNQKRLENGLNSLQINPILNEAAQRKAADMFAFNYWAHTSPSGRDPWSFFQEAGYKYVYAGENLARDFMTSPAVVEAWMNSSSHKENLLNGKYKEIGVAVVNGTLNGVETTLVVQSFGTPPSAGVAKKPSVPQARASLGESISTTLLQPKAALAQASSSESATPSMLSPFMITKTIIIFVLGLIFGVLALDAILVWQRRIVRLSGKNLAHLFFIGTLLLGVILTNAGKIL